jgi:predicted ATP-grasp superfamily ATP-dependent carboligase
MRVLVYEYLSAGQPGAESLRREGRAMLTAALADLSACRGIDAAAMPAAAPGEEEAVFRDLARGCDAALVVAPEFDGILATRAEWALEEGCRLLGPSPEAIRLTADKLRLGQLWRGRGLATPETLLLEPGASPFAFPVVVKPRDGAGAMATFRIDNWDHYEGIEYVWQGDLVVQRFAGDGRAASVAFLIGPGGTVALAPASQDIAIRPGGSMHYRGGRVPFPLQAVAIDLAARAVACVPGLRGYVGVDLALGDEPTVIEINPRLTTSYVGLRRLARFNVMQAMLDVLDGRPPGALDYAAGEVTFLPDGSFPDEAGG